MLGQHHRQLPVGRRLAVPIHGDDVDAVLFAGLAHVPLGTQSDVVQPLVDQCLRPAAHLLVIDIGDRCLQREQLAAGVLRDVGLRPEGEAPFAVGHARPLSDHLAIGAVVLPPATGVVVGEVPPPLALVVEEAISRQHTVTHLGVCHRPAKEVGGLGGNVDLIALHVLRLVRLHRHLEFRLTILSHLESGANVLLLIDGLDGVITQGCFLAQLKLTIHSPHIAERHGLLKHTRPLAVVDGHLHFGVLARQSVVSVVVLTYDALEVDLLARSVDGTVGEEVGRHRLQVILHRHVKLPRRYAVVPPADGDGKILVRLVWIADKGENRIPDVNRLVLVAHKYTVAVRLAFGQNIAPLVHQLDRQARRDVTRFQIGCPHQRISGRGLQGQVVLGHDYDLPFQWQPIIPFRLRVDCVGWGLRLQIIDARVQTGSFLSGQVGAVDQALVQLRCHRQRPRPYQVLAGAHIVTPILPGILAIRPPEILQRHMIQSEINLVQVAHVHVGHRGRVGQVCAHPIGRIEIHHGVHGAGTPPNGGVLVQLLSIPSPYVAAERDFVVAAGLGVKRNLQPGVARPPIRVNLRRRDGRGDGEVVVDGARIHRAGEGHLQIVPGISVVIAIGWIGREDAGILDGGEGPHVVLACSRLTLGPLGAFSYYAQTGGPEIEGTMGGEAHRLRTHTGRPLSLIPRVAIAALPSLLRLRQPLVAPLEGAFHLLGLLPAVHRESCLCRFSVHWLVEGHLDGGLNADVDVVLVRGSGHHRRHHGGELPGVVLGQHAAGGVGQAVTDTRLVGGGRFKPLIRGEHVDGSVQPFPLPPHRGHKGDRLRQPVLILNGRQGYHRPVEQHGHHSLGCHLGSAVSRLNSRHLQEANRLEMVAQRLLQGQASLAQPALFQAHRVAGGPFKAGLRLELHNVG